MQRCPSCSRSWPESAFQCPVCELLLVGDLASLPPPTERLSLVRGLMERPQAERQAGALTPPPVGLSQGRETLPMRALPEMDQVPELVAALRMSELDLTPFEAFVASRLDGYTSAAQLAHLLELQPIEMGVVLQNLVSKSLVRLHRPSAPEARPRPEPEPESQPPLVAPSPFRPAAPAPVAPPARAPEPVASPFPAPAPVQAKGDPERDRLRGAWGNLFSRPGGQPKAPPRESPLQRVLRLEQAGRIDEAVRVLDQAIAQSPDAAPLYNRLAIVLATEHRNLKEAERLLQKAVALAPENPVYQRNLYAVITRLASG